MVVTENPETFEERMETALRTIAKLAKWPHCNHDDASNVRDYHRDIDSAVSRGLVPGWVGRDRRHMDRTDYETYDWQIFATTIARLARLSESEVAEYLEEQRNLDNPISATDGSRGQWAAARSARVKTAEWLLTGEE